MPIESTEKHLNVNGGPYSLAKIAKIRQAIDFVIQNEKPQLYKNKNGYPLRMEYRFYSDASNSPWQYFTKIPSIISCHDNRVNALPKENSTMDLTSLKLDSSTSCQGSDQNSINMSLKPSSCKLGLSFLDKPVAVSHIISKPKYERKTDLNFPKTIPKAINQAGAINSRDSSTEKSQFQKRGKSFLKMPVAVTHIPSIPKCKTMIGRNSSKVASNSPCQETDQNSQHIISKRIQFEPGISLLKRSAGVIQTATSTKYETKIGQNFRIASHSQFNTSVPKYKSVIGHNSPIETSNSAFQNQHSEDRNSNHLSFKRGISFSRRSSGVSPYYENIIPKHETIIEAQKYPELPKVVSEQQECQKTDQNSQSISPKHTQLQRGVSHIKRFAGFSSIKSLQKGDCCLESKKKSDLDVIKSVAASSCNDSTKSSYEVGHAGFKCRREVSYLKRPASKPDSILLPIHKSSLESNASNDLDVMKVAPASSGNEYKNNLHEVGHFDSTSRQGKKKTSSKSILTATNTIMGNANNNNVEFYLYAKSIKNKLNATNSNVNPVGHKPLKSAHEKIVKKPTIPETVAKSNNILTEKKSTKGISQACKRSIMDKIPSKKIERSQSTANSIYNHKSEEKRNEKESQEQIEAADGEAFLNLVHDEQARIFALANKAGQYMSDYSNILDEDISGILRLAKGKACLLANEKMKQFEGLCQRNINMTPDEKLPVTISDLRGFWDMVKMQVEDIDGMFRKINNLKNNNWRKTKSKSRLSRNI